MDFYSNNGLFNTNIPTIFPKFKEFSERAIFFFNKIISTNSSINNNVIYVSFENARVAQWLELRAYSNIRFPKFLCQRPFKQAFKSNATVVGSIPTSSTFSFFFKKSCIISINCCSYVTPNFVL